MKYRNWWDQNVRARKPFNPLHMILEKFILKKAVAKFINKGREIISILPEEIMLKI